MECDYVDHEYVDLLTLKDVNITKESPTTYIHVQNTLDHYEISGYLSYVSTMKGNNLIVSLPGKIKIKFNA